MIAERIAAEEFREDHGDLVRDFILSRLLSPREAATLNEVKHRILRAYIRSEILTNEQVRQALAERVKKVVQELAEVRQGTTSSSGSQG